MNGTSLLILGVSLSVDARARPSPDARRSAGDLPVKPNPHIEAWGTKREHIEEGFRFDARAYARAALWVVGVPAAIYFGILTDFRATEERAGAAHKKFLGGSE